MFYTVNGVIVGPKVGNFGGICTWATRPTSGTIGDKYLVSDLNYAEFIWDGTRLVSTSEQILTGTAVVGTPHTGTTARTAIVSVTVPGGLLGPNGSLSFLFTSTGVGAGSKLWNLTLGGTDIFHAGPTGQTWQGGQCIVTNRNSNSSQQGLALNLSSPYVTGVNTPMNSTVDTTVDQTLTLNATLGTSGDSMTLQSWRVLFMSRA